MREYYLLILFFLFSTVLFAELPLGEVPPKILLEDEFGGRLDGTKWSSEELVSGKITILFYVDPDESDLNNHVSEALKAEKFPLDKYGSIAIINMAATWLPNFALNMKLKSKQENYKNTVYVKDLQKILVNRWGLTDDSSDVMVFSKKGEVLYSVDGKFSDSQVVEIINIVKENL